MLTSETRLLTPLSFCRYTPCIRAANTFARRKAKGDSDAEAKSAQEKSRLVSRRRHFARLEELRAQFEGFATVCLDGPFDMKDHPCLVRHRSPRTSSPRVRTCKTAAVGNTGSLFHFATLSSQAPGRWAMSVQTGCRKTGKSTDCTLQLCPD